MGSRLGYKHQRSICDVYAVYVHGRGVRSAPNSGLLGGSFQYSNANEGSGWMCLLRDDVQCEAGPYGLACVRRAVCHRQTEQEIEETIQASLGLWVGL